MLYDTTTQPQLRQWLIRTLEPICDADPIILADYVIALLSHDGPEYELRKMFMSQLEEFLDQKSTDFVDSLFSALRSKAYLPYNAPSPSATSEIRASGDSGIPIPLDALVPTPSSPSDRGRKRAFDSRDDMDVVSRPPPKGPRMHNQNHPARYGRGDWGRGGRTNQQSYRDDDMDGVPTRPRHGVQNNGAHPNDSDPQRQKPICRDYHHKGYCARGALCNYSHGEDAVVPPGPMWMPPNGSNFNPMMGPMGLLPMMMPFGMPNLEANGPSSAYDPNESGMNMNPMMNLPMAAMANGSPSGTDAMAVDGALGPSVDSMPYLSNVGSSFENGNLSNGIGTDSSRHTSDVRGGRGGRRPQGSGRGPSKDDKTLVIEKIPPEHLGLGAINDWFKRFGVITNVAVDNKGAKALITFSTHDEASLAWKSQDAVFGNRFVKVYWHRPMEGQGVAGKRALEASASIVQSSHTAEATTSSTSISIDSKPASSQHSESTPRQPSKPSIGPKAKVDQLERNIAEQKVLFSRLKSATGQEKKTIIARIRVLSEAAEKAPDVTPPLLLSKEENGASSKLALLDKELDLQQAVQDLTRRAQDPNEDQETIRKELEELTKKAASEGIHIGEDNEPIGAVQPPHYTPPTTYYRPYRGRGRSRPSYRGGLGRGTGHSNFKLDNRPKKLLLLGVPPNDDQLLDHVREWHQATGQADTLIVGDNGDITAQFRTRLAAEQALASSSSLKEHISSIRVSWPVSAPSTALPSATSQNHKVENDTDTVPFLPVSEEKEEESGWGQGDDD